MTDTWVALVIAGAILLIGFLASLSFDRFHIPDFIVLILLGVLLGHIPVEPFGSTMVESLTPVLPAFVALTLAFTMFEGGLTLRLEIAHFRKGLLFVLLGSSMVLTFLVVTLLGEILLGLERITAVVMAAAFIGPSATIAISFAPRLKIRSRVSGTLILEGIIANIAAVVVIIFILNFGGSTGTEAVLQYTTECAITVGGAFVIGFAWHFASERLTAHRFVAMATVTVAIVVFAVFDGLIGGNGALAAFIFGFAVGYVWPFEKNADSFITHDGSLKTFQSEVSFALRTFFFVYLGLLMTLESLTIPVVIAAVLISVGMIAARGPATIGLHYVLDLKRVESRVVFGNVSRGMTDVILILLAIQSGVLPAADTNKVITTLTLVVLITAAISATLLFSAGRRAHAESKSEEEVRPIPDI